MRELINKYGVYIIAAAIVLAGLSYWLIAPRTARQDIVKSAYYIDEETGEESIHSINEFPPLLGKSGKPTVVMVTKYSCDGGKTCKPLFYMKYTDAAHAALVALDAKDDASGMRRNTLMSEGELIRNPAPGSPWVPGTSEEALRLQSPPCPRGTFCHPAN